MSKTIKNKRRRSKGPLPAFGAGHTISSRTLHPEGAKNESGSPTPAPGAVPPDKATVADWVRKDLNSAHYLLGVVLHRYPQIIDEIADRIFEHAMTKENGAAIDYADRKEN